MRFLAPLLLLVLCVVAGCGGDPSSSSTVPQPPPPRPVRNLKSYQPGPMPPFRGEAAKSMVKWDLAGNWMVSRLPGKLGPWESKWKLRKVITPGQLTWEDDHAKWTYVLSDRLPQMLIWDHDGTTWYFSINEHSPGLLMMTGNDGARYKATRLEATKPPAPPEIDGE
jgi:hypothetical protein